MTTTYLSTEQRQSLIEEYMDCWFDTASYSSESTATVEGDEMRALLHAMNNSELVAEIQSSGWEIF